MQPFAAEAHPSVDALSKMSASLESELCGTLAFFGEDPESPEAPKPEDFFGMILSFSSSLQKAAVEVHDKEEESRKEKEASESEVPVVKVDTAKEETEGVRVLSYDGVGDRFSDTSCRPSRCLMRSKLPHHLWVAQLVCRLVVVILTRPLGA